MKPKDRDLGMDRPISRRDLLQGMGAVAASTFVPGDSFADAVLGAETAGGVYYPPALSGMQQIPARDGPIHSESAQLRNQVRNG